MIKQNAVLFLLSVCFLIYSCSVKQPEIIDLSGIWQFQMDPADLGIKEKWFDTELTDSVHLPGSMVENGKGYKISLDTKWTGGMRNPQWYKDPNYSPYEHPGEIRFPYWLQPEKKYTGVAWYEKKINIPENWNKKTATLFLERPHWETKVWINGKYAGMQNSLAIPHKYHISSLLKPGENTITVCVDNRTKDIDVGQDSHSITDQTQSNWNGIVGNIFLKATGVIFFDNVKVYPEIKSRSVMVEAFVFNSTNHNKHIKILASAALKNTNKKTKGKTFKFMISPGNNRIKLNYPLGEDALFWDEFEPNIYQLSLELKTKESSDIKTIDFGLREFKVLGTRFAINGRPVFLRGTLECAIFPLTGYPPTNIESWEKVFSAIKAHGLNHMRFHSWCPPEAAFEAADKMGVYLQVECSSWANGTAELGSGFPVDQYIWDESKRIVNAYGNHPSFVMMVYGNEPGGPKYREFLTKFVNYWKETDARRVYSGASGWPVLAANDYHVIPAPRIQGWGEELNSIINAKPPCTNYDWKNKLPGDGIPVVSHEIGQWCVYPDFKEIKEYTGVLKPKNFEIFKESLSAHHMENLADSFLLASGKLQALCYKADIEAALRTPGFAGFQLLDLHDFPGQGTALVGVLNPFWREKGYISPKEYRRFCNTTVPLARLTKRIFTEGETMTANIEVAHFGEKSLNINPSWKIKQNETVIAEGTLGQQDIPIGNSIQLGKVIYRFQKKNIPRKMILEISVGDFINSWDIWIYPESRIEDYNDIKVVENFTPSSMKFLEVGGKILLSLGRGKVSPEMGGKEGVGFSSIFWNTAWTGGQKPHTLGILCNPNHPALKDFPTKYYSNWQWWDAMSHADAIQLDAFPVELKPIVQIIDDWVTNRKLALIFEAKIGRGKLMVCGTDLVNDLDKRIEAKQLRNSLIRYMKSDKFNPCINLTRDDIQKIIK